MSRKAEITKDVLCILGALGLIAAVVVAPNVISVLSKHNSFRKYDKKKLNNSIKYLRRSGMIAVGQEGQKTIVRLTKNGEERFLKYKVEDLKIPQPRKWNKRWWIIIFDIPEEYKLNRTVFVKKLKELGFVMVQKSVWIYPYSCEKEIDFLKGIYDVGQYVRIVESNYIDIQDDLMEKFSL